MKLWNWRWLLIVNRHGRNGVPFPKVFRLIGRYVKITWGILTTRRNYRLWYDDAVALVVSLPLVNWFSESHIYFNWATKYDKMWFTGGGQWQINNKSCLLWILRIARDSLSIKMLLYHDNRWSRITKLINALLLSWELSVTILPDCGLITWLICVFCSLLQRGLKIARSALAQKVVYIRG